ncbi:hypothetical protein ACFFIX_13905 [Metabacillus herbersteinensis]|uniref:Uncharacterized protein n=1 Tax=Metabacillus herbersteinensis TaxID=283816 RepID=A0ABV6GH83_9BACI
MKGRSFLLKELDEEGDMVFGGEFSVTVLTKCICDVNRMFRLDNEVV